MKVRTNAGLTRVKTIRAGYGSVIQVLAVGERQFRDVRFKDVVLETEADVLAWAAYMPSMQPESIDLEGGE